MDWPANYVGERAVKATFTASFAMESCSSSPALPKVELHLILGNCGEPWCLWILR